MDNTSWSRGNTALICRVPLALNPVNLNRWNIFPCSCLTLREDNDDNDDGGEDADNHMRSVDSLCNVLMYEPKVTCTTSFYPPRNPLRHIFWFYRWENWGLQRLSNLPKVIQLVKQRSQDLNTAMFEFKFVFLVSTFCWSIPAGLVTATEVTKIGRGRLQEGVCPFFLFQPSRVSHTSSCQSLTGDKLAKRNIYSSSCSTIDRSMKRWTWSLWFNN